MPKPAKQTCHNSQVVHSRQMYGKGLNTGHKFILTFAAIPPTKILLGIRVPYFGAWLMREGVPAGVTEAGDTSPDDV